MPSPAILIGYGLYTISEYLMGKTRFGSWIGILIEAPVKKIIAWVVGKPDAPVVSAPAPAPAPVAPAPIAATPAPTTEVASGSKPPA